MANEMKLEDLNDPMTLLTRVGHLTRQLRDGLRELGLDRQVAMAAEAIPDSRDRLKYIATMTEQAAERALNAVDVAQPLQDELAKSARKLKAQWVGATADAQSAAQGGALAQETLAFLDKVPAACSAINAQLLEITMAQDFQDLTGQVIKKMMEMINEVETQLLQVLVDHAPKGTFPESDVSLMNGPQINAGGAGATSQADIDAMLASMGV